MYEGEIAVFVGIYHYAHMAYASLDAPAFEEYEISLTQLFSVYLLSLKE